MYTVNKTRSRKKLLLEFLIALLVLFGLLAFALWFFIFRTTDESSANFSRAGGTVAIVEAATKEFTVDEFTLDLPAGWELLGKKNPFSNQVYYEFQSKVQDYENRWLRVYVDVIPEDYTLNKLLPITVIENKLEAGTVSEDCKTFNGAPKISSGQTSSQTWKATWEDITFICNMVGQQNHIGTANAKDGYAVPVTGPTKGTHKYFFVYIDHNVRPDTSILIDAVDSFEAL
jgi:hypothetical protein